MLSMSNAVTNLSNDEISKITFNERLQKLTTTSEDIKKEAKKLSVIYDKMKEIESSLNEDEKREYEQLGLLNDDEKS